VHPAERAKERKRKHLTLEATAREKGTTIKRTHVYQLSAREKQQHPVHGRCPQSEHPPPSHSSKQD